MVRDRIPEIIQSSGRSYETHIAEEKEYEKMLLTKLHEEVDELIETPCMEEIADIYEVLDSIISHYDFDRREVEKIKLKKRNDRGGFENRIILEHVK